MEVEVRKRTPWIWAIFIFYLFAAGTQLASQVLALLGIGQMNVSYAAMLYNLVILSGATTLFSLRRMAFYLFAAACAMTYIGIVWLLYEGMPSVMPYGMFFIVLTHLIILSCSCYYSWKLMKRGVLI